MTGVTSKAQLLQFKEQSFVRMKVKVFTGLWKSKITWSYKHAESGHKKGMWTRIHTYNDVLMIQWNKCDCMAQCDGSEIEFAFRL